jgi:hypothetical protein
MPRVSQPFHSKDPNVTCRWAGFSRTWKTATRRRGMEAPDRRHRRAAGGMHQTYTPAPPYPLQGWFMESKSVQCRKVGGKGLA